jgi:hypothetical protein
MRLLSDHYYVEKRIAFLRAKQSLICSLFLPKFSWVLVAPHLKKSLFSLLFRAKNLARHKTEKINLKVTKTPEQFNFSRRLVTADKNFMNFESA